MNEWLTSVVDLFAQNPPLAYAVVFLVAMGEALLIIGLFVPSTVVLVGAGTLVGMGSLPATPVIIATFLGAVVGDQLSFLAGRHGQQRIRASRLMTRYALLFAQGEAFVARHGGKSVFIGRFVPGVKAVIPAIAGMAGMSPLRFTSVNVVSSIAWTAAHLLPAFALGRGISVAHAGNPRLLILGAVLLLAGGLAWWLVRLARSRLLPLAERLRDRLIVWLGLHRRPEPHWLERLLRNHNDVLRLTAYSMVALAAAIGFTMLAVKLMIDPVLVQADLAISNGLRGLQSVDMTELMVGMTMLGDGVVLLPLAVALIIGLWLGRERRLALSVALAFGGAALFVPMIKASLQRNRPTDLYLGAEAFSFPSGHATLTATIIGITVLVLAHPLPPAGRRIAYGCAALLVMLVAFSRVYLQAHWPTDVAAGLLVGSMLVFIMAVLLHDRNVTASPRALAAAVGITYFVAAGWHLGGQYAHERGRYLVQAAPSPVSQARWLADEWASLTRYRAMLAGRRGERLALQTDLPLPTMLASLAADGWQPSAGRWLDALVSAVLPSRPPLSDLPALPLTHYGRRPVASLIKPLPADQGRLVLRLWESEWVIDAPPSGTDPGGPRPLLLGSLTVEQIKHLPLGLILVDHDPGPADPDPVIDQAVAKIATGLPGESRFHPAPPGPLWTVAVSDP